MANTALRIALLFVLALAASPPASALSYVMISDEDLLEQSEGVVKVSVIEAMPSKDGDKNTLYRVSIDEVLRGASLGRQRLISMPGTFTAKTANWVVPGVPQLVSGQTYLLFYTSRSDGVLLPQQLTLGVFGRVPAAQGDVYVRHLSDDGESAKRSNMRKYHGARSAKRFEEWARSGGTGDRVTTDYFVDRDAAQLKFGFSIFQFPQPGPARWFQFDSGQTQTWTARPEGQANTAQDEFQSLQNALAGWVNDPGSRVLMSYSGTAATTPACSLGDQSGCFTGHVKWNDPDNAIAGSFNCGMGGVLGIGGSTAFSPGQTFNGENWYRRGGAVVTVQDGAGCFLDANNGANGAELLAHEIGHTLVFAHSCGDSATPACASDAVLNQALMRAQAHGDGRGASLGQDDRAGIAIAYPESNPPSANMSVQVSANQSAATPGQSVTYTITLLNAGPNEATSLQLNTTLPPEVNLNSASGSNWSCNPGTANCTRASLGSGSSSTVNVTISLPPGYAGPASLNLQASISSAVPDPAPSNNSAQLAIPVDMLAASRIFGGPVNGGFEAL